MRLSRRFFVYNQQISESEAMKRKISAKRIYELADEGDGYRMLVDHLWPRGLKKEDARLDEWNKKIAPSNELRKWFAHKPERFDEFVLRYREELHTKTDELLRLNQIADSRGLTLLFAAKDTNHNQAVVLLQLLNSMI